MLKTVWLPLGIKSIINPENKANEKYKSRFNDYILENAHVLNSEYGEVYEKGWGNSTTNSLRVQYLPISNLQLSYKF